MLTALLETLTALLETGTALLETRTSLHKQCKTICLLQNVFFKMSESEHLDSEFYYPGKLSGVEMLQLSTHTEAAERNSLE